MSSPWRLYDDLIDGIPSHVQTADCMTGIAWVMVRSDLGGAGISHVVPEASRPFQYTGELCGVPLRGLAQCVKSWNLVEASIGLAAINAWYNTEDRLNGLRVRWAEEPGQDIFPMLIDRVWGKRVAIVGRFPNIERRLRPVCFVTVLAPDPQEGEYPESACEFLLPKQDFVFLSSRALIHKTLPRLLELAAQAEISLVGPSAPLSPLLLAHGLHYLSGSCVVNPERIGQVIRRGGRPEIYAGLRKAELNFLMA